MTKTTARIKRLGKTFEIIVDLDNAVKFKNGEINSIECEGDIVFSDAKKGFKASPADLKEAFRTEDINEIATKIINEGEVLLTQEYRNKEREEKLKQIIDFLSRNAIDPQTGNPISSERIKTALEEAKINIKNKPIDSQISEIIEQLNRVISIKLEIKKIKVIIPAIHTGKAYGIIAPYKIKEDWKDDGSLEAILEVPSGLIMDFYDKLNSITHGSALTEDLKD